MNGRAPEYRRCNEITIINPKTRQFKTFWKNVHQQFLITDGKVEGCTFTVGKAELTEKGPGNALYKELRQNGWKKWEDFCEDKGGIWTQVLRDFGRVLY